MPLVLDARLKRGRRVEQGKEREKERGVEGEAERGGGERGEKRRSKIRVDHVVSTLTLVGAAIFFSSISCAKPTEAI